MPNAVKLILRAITSEMRDIVIYLYPRRSCYRREIQQQRRRKAPKSRAGHRGNVWILSAVLAHLLRVVGGAGGRRTAAKEKPRQSGGAVVIAFWKLIR